MDRLHIFLICLGSISCYHFWVSGSIIEVTIRPGDNVTLYCDCKALTGFFTVWFRNCSHENQPSLVLPVKPDDWQNPKKRTRFEFVKNSSTDSYDLFIMNVSASDEGSYYCGTKELKRVIKEQSSEPVLYNYSNITTLITLESTNPPQDHLCWNLLFSLCPAVSVLSSLFASLLVYRLCQKTDDEKRKDTKSQLRQTQGEDVCYAALEIHEASQRPKRKRRTPSSDFSTYSAIKLSQV